ncbi:hypothetical protein KSS87_007834 [Heliosperma pusillum]|nr:hypothetical protein KSS87_007834 [Heliosperma pusillum]
MLYYILFIILTTPFLFILHHHLRRRRNHRLPPGTYGLPLLGETLQLIAAYKTDNPEPFIDERVGRYGPIFKTHVFGEPTIFSVDPDVNRFILQNEGRLFESSNPASVSNLLGRHSLVVMKGSLHKRMHFLTLSFSNDAIIRDHLLVDIDRLVRFFMDSWSDRVFLMDEAKKVINESLRVANTVGGVFRRTTSDINVKGYTIPKGWKIFASFRGVHMDDQHFKDARSFNPWRWQSEAGKPLPLGVFTPFGGGPRLCPGYKLARASVSVFLHYLVTKFRFLIMAKITLRNILDANKLSGNNFDDWYRNLRIVLMHEKLIDVIDKSAMVAPLEGESNASALDACAEYSEESTAAKCIILASMSPEPQRQYENMTLSQIIAHLKKMYEFQSQTSNVEENQLINESTVEPEQPENQIDHEPLRRWWAVVGGGHMGGARPE